MTATFTISVFTDAGGLSAGGLKSSVGSLAFSFTLLVIVRLRAIAIVVHVHTVDQSIPLAIQVNQRDLGEIQKALRLGAGIIHS